jgi:hypothetical protein
MTTLTRSSAVGELALIVGAVAAGFDDGGAVVGGEVV